MVSNASDKNHEIAHLRQANAALAQLLAASAIGIITLDQHLCLRQATPPAVALLQLQPADTGQPLDRLRPPLADPALGADAAHVLASRTPLERELRYGDERWLLVTINPYQDQVSGDDGLLLTLFDITRWKRSDQQDGHQQLRALSQRLLAAQEAERRALAAEMHDEIGQLLTGLNLLLLSIDPHDDAERIAAHLAQAQRVVSELTARVRHLTLDLRPPMLDDLGLGPTLEWLAERYTAQTRVQVQLQHPDPAQRFPPMLELTVYRIIQEALTNVARHAATTTVSVQVWSEGEQVHVLVADQGRGFDPHALDPSHSSGLSGMAERVRLLGGTLTVMAAPGSGTSIHATLPLSAPEPATRGEYRSS